MCVCVCVCVNVLVLVLVCVCVRETERERERACVRVCTTVHNKVLELYKSGIWSYKAAAIKAMEPLRIT